MPKIEQNRWFFIVYPLIENVKIDQIVGILQSTPLPKMSQKNSDGSRNPVIAGGVTVV